MTKFPYKTTIVGAVTGFINGIFGAGGGMVLVPLLRASTNLDEQEIFPSSVSIMLPMCIMTLCIYSFQQPLPIVEALPYLFGSVLGGVLAGLFGSKIPVMWLHRILGLLILWGGIRYLW